MVSSEREEWYMSETPPKKAEGSLKNDQATVQHSNNQTIKEASKIRTKIQLELKSKIKHIQRWNVPSVRVQKVERSGPGVHQYTCAVPPSLRLGGVVRLIVPGRS